MPADADLIICSKAASQSLADMTQRAISGARIGAVPYTLDVYVMEQCNVEYRDATTIYAPGSFNYNAFLNHAAKQGNSEWIVFANSDLRFTEGWLKELVKVGHSVMSPVSTGYHRQRALWKPVEYGQEVGRHLAGWCFMMRRSLWESIGGLDETYPFWCADNAVMEQLCEAGIVPALVRDSVVYHEVSSTLQRETHAAQDEMTWASVHKWNETHDAKILLGDPRYRNWKQRNGIRGG